MEPAVPVGFGFYFLISSGLGEEMSSRVDSITFTWSSNRKLTNQHLLGVDSIRTEVGQMQPKLVALSLAMQVRWTFNKCATSVSSTYSSHKVGGTKKNKTRPMLIEGSFLFIFPMV
jgi:hypothetical protein